MQSNDSHPPGAEPDDTFHQPSQNPHDSLFRSTFSQPENAAGLIQSLLPGELAKQLRFDSLTLQSGSFVDQHLKNLHSDLLFTIDFLDGRQAFIYILLEHQSSADPWMPLRMLSYQVRIWEKFIELNPNAKKLPVILPLHIFHHPTEQPASPNFEDLYDIDPHSLALLRHIAVRMHILTDHLNAYSTEDICKREVLTTAARLAFVALRNSRSPAELFATLSLWVPLIADILNAKNGRIALTRIFRYMTITQKAEQKQRWHEALSESLHSLNQAKEIAMNIAEAYVQEGRSKGKIEGKIEALQSLLLKQLTQRFGHLPDTATARIHSANAEQLELWGERILSASSLDDVFL